MSEIQKKLYIIRHGETDLNKNGVVQGRGVNSPLNLTGIAQGNAFYEMYKNVPFDKLYTSTLVRTEQTVAKFIDAGLPWERLAGLDELAWGIHEGQNSTPELRDDFKKLIAHWAEGSYDEKFEGGESPNEVFTRQANAMKEIMSHKDEKTVLICMHGRAMRLLLCQLMKQSLDHMDEYPHKNTSLYILDYDGKDFTIQTFNNVAHLKDL
ncbi:histidine phosphatase family protein [Pedobacter sp. SD-b]|uniref:Histidine phosphatase family protein n=1 Tax=Pedobacter segetis TaxID=2793069 RepID=A0ABS1BP44_9SPHI|nr:histidine phosphatase family protein [Pedobacter segetis]MBK0384009.1 histidine phosphatase family protein [Pedobacter segetis]